MTNQGRKLKGSNPAADGACNHPPMDAAVSHNPPPAASGGGKGGDLRQGVTRAGHAVLDQLEAIGGGIGGEKTVPALALKEAQRILAAAIRADPDNGMGRRRIAMSREAAALIIRALDSMDEAGRSSFEGTVA